LVAALHCSNALDAYHRHGETRNGTSGNINVQILDRPATSVVQARLYQKIFDETEELNAAAT
jgi:hypothetical protein